MGKKQKLEKVEKSNNKIGDKQQQRAIIKATQSNDNKKQRRLRRLRRQRRCHSGASAPRLFCILPIYTVCAVRCVGCLKGETRRKSGERGAKTEPKKL